MTDTNNNPAVQIEIEYANGDIRRARSSDDAAQIWKWWLACEQMNCIHGAEYKGPCLELIKDTDK